MDGAETLGGERARVAALAPDFSSEQGFNARLIDFRFDSLAPYLDGVDSCLELGCADGRMTERLAATVPQLTAVDGSAEYVARVRARLPQVDAVHALFEEYAPARRFDAVVLGHVLEHVSDPRALLALARGLLEPDGIVLATVPNANSLHRQAGVQMGLLRSVTDLNEADLRIGHRRVYTRETLLADVAAAGLSPVHCTGVFLKPLSNAQIEAQWSEETIGAFYALGHAHPEICAELLVVARAA